MNFWSTCFCVQINWLFHSFLSLALLCVALVNQTQVELWFGGHSILLIVFDSALSHQLTYVMNGFSWLQMSMIEIHDGRVVQFARIKGFNFNFFGNFLAIWNHHFWYFNVDPICIFILLCQRIKGCLQIKTLLLLFNLQKLFLLRIIFVLFGVRICDQGLHLASINRWKSISLRTIQPGHYSV